MVYLEVIGRYLGIISLCIIVISFFFEWRTKRRKKNDTPVILHPLDRNKSREGLGEIQSPAGNKATALISFVVSEKMSEIILRSAYKMNDGETGDFYAVIREMIEPWTSYIDKIVSDNKISERHQKASSVMLHGILKSEIKKRSLKLAKQDLWLSNFQVTIIKIKKNVVTEKKVNAEQ